MASSSSLPCSAGDRLIEEAINAFDPIIGPVLDDISLDGSLHKSPSGHGFLDLSAYDAFNNGQHVDE